MNGVLVESADIVVLLHLLAFAGATLLQCNQQLSLGATQSYNSNGSLNNCSIRDVHSVQLTVIQLRSLLLHITRDFIHVNQVLLDLRQRFDNVVQLIERNRIRCLVELS